MRVTISGGGTAGHVYPALTVLETAGDRAHDVTWIGTGDSLEHKLVTRHGLPFRAVGAGPIVGVSPRRLMSSVVRLTQGTWQSWRLLGQEAPDSVLVTGGYVCVPVSVAAWLRRIPLAVFLPDVKPGRAVALVARIADRVAVTSQAAVAHLPPGKALVTGYPVREVLRTASRAEARKRFGLDEDIPTVLVFGGSQGARSINEALAGAAPDLLTRAAVLHIAGTRGHARAQQACEGLSDEGEARYHLFAYLHDDDMAAALACADLVVSRAGAAVLGEFAALGLPAILVPLPIASGHQTLNAQALVDAGAAVLLPDESLSGHTLATEVTRVLADGLRLTRMAEASRTLDRPDAASSIWEMLEELVDGGPNPRATTVQA